MRGIIPQCSYALLVFVPLDSFNAFVFSTMGHTIEGACCFMYILTSFSFFWVDPFLNFDIRLFLKVKLTTFCEEKGYSWRHSKTLRYSHY